MHPLVLDTSALLGLGRVTWLSGSVAGTHYRQDVPVLVPALCLVAAGRQRQHLVAHVGGLPAMNVVELAHHLVAFERRGWPEQDAANAAIVALPSPDHPAGIPVVTEQPDKYQRWSLRMVSLEQGI